MSHRIFVNTQNAKWKAVTNNAKGNLWGLGIPTELSEDERSELRQLAYEVYFSADDLRDKNVNFKLFLTVLLTQNFLVMEQ